MTTSSRITEVTIAPFEPRDRPGLITLWQLVFPPRSPHHDPNLSLDLKLAQRDNLLLVARLADHIVGAVMAGYDGHRGWLYSVAVHPDHRRRSIGRLLIQHAESALAALNCPKINLQITADNGPVTAFYEKLGYTVEPRISMGKILDETRDRT